MMGRAIFTVTAELPAPNDRRRGRRRAVPQTCAGERKVRLCLRAHDRPGRKRWLLWLAVDGQAVDVLQAVPPDAPGDLNGPFRWGARSRRDRKLCSRQMVVPGVPGYRPRKPRDIPQLTGRRGRCPAPPGKAEQLQDRPLPRLADSCTARAPRKSLVTGPQIGFVGADVERVKRSSR